jgi:predicted nucleotidyltransferase
MGNRWGQLREDGKMKLKMTIQNLRQTGRETILSTAARYGARNVRVFGSVARGSAGDQSDLDLSTFWWT